MSLDRVKEVLLHENSIRHDGSPSKIAVKELSGINHETDIKIQNLLNSIVNGSYSDSSIKKRSQEIRHILYRIGFEDGWIAARDSK